MRTATHFVAKLFLAAVVAGLASASGVTVTLGTTVVTTNDGAAFSLDISTLVDSISNTSTSVTVTDQTSSGTGLTLCSGVAYSSGCTLTGSGSGGVIPAGNAGNRTMRIAFENGGVTTTEDFTLTVLSVPTVSLTATDANAGTYSLTVSFSTGIASFDSSGFDITEANGGATLTCQTGSYSSPTYTTTCSATGRSGTVGVTVPANSGEGYSNGADTATYSPQLVGISLTSGVGPNQDITQSSSAELVFEFSGPMLNIQTSDFTPNADSTEAVSGSSNTQWSADFTLSSTSTTISIATTASYVDFTATSGTSFTAKYDQNAPTVTVTSSPIFLSDGQSQSLDIATEVLSALSDDVTANNDLKVKLAASSNISSALKINDCGVEGPLSGGCSISGLNADTIPEGSSGAYEFELGVTDQSGRNTTVTFTVIVRATILEAAGASILTATYAAPFDHPSGTTRTVSAELTDVCTSTGDDDKIKLAVTTSDGSICSITNDQPENDEDTTRDGTQGAQNPVTISCTFTGATTVTWTVECGNQFGSETEEKDVPATVTGTWTAVANTPPSVTATGSFVYGENDAATKLSDDLTFSITDSEDSNLSKLTVERRDCVSGKDALSVDSSSVPGTISAAVADCLVTFTPQSGRAAALSDFATALDQVMFAHSSDNPNSTLGVTLVINATDNAADDTSTNTPSYFLGGSTTVSFTIVEQNDVLSMMVSSGAINASASNATATGLRIPENPADGACLRDSNGNDIEFTVEDVDTIQATNQVADQTDIHLEILAWTGATAPDTEFWTVKNTSAATLSATSQTGSSLVPGATEHFVYQKFKVCVAAKGAQTSAGETRPTWSTIDYENLAPYTWGAMTEEKALPLRIRASSPSGMHARTFVIWYQVEDDDTEQPHFFHPAEDSILLNGRRANATGIQNARSYYRSSLKPAFTYNSANLNTATGNIAADTVTTEFYAISSENRSLNATFAPVDFVHGQYNEIAFPFASVAVDADNMESPPVFTLEYKGEVSRDATPDLLSAPASPVLFSANDTSTLSGLFPATPNATTEFRFRQNATHIVFSGTPAYDNTYSLNATWASGNIVSPSAKRLHFVLTATIPGSGLKTSRNMYVDIEIRGCMDVRGSYVNGTSFLAASGPFNPPDASSPAAWNNSLPWKNLQGNFNPSATVPSLCTFPPRSVAPDTPATFSVQGARTESTVAELEAALGATPSDDDLESARGFVALNVPAGSVTGSVPIEVAGVTEDVAIAVPPPDDNAIVDADLSIKLGPCGQQFEKELEVCVFVGKQVPDRYYVMYHAPAVSCDQPELGYSEFSPTTGNVYNAATGKLCGKISSFSIVSGVSLPVPTYSQLEARYFVMGGGCPNECSGHGYCRAYGKCFCFEGFGGYDCSKRTCPYGESWAANSVITRVVEECSGRGECDGASGECRCFPGFEGPACERLACENGCSGHGRCRFISELPSATGYSEWDASRIQSCLCDPGYFGSDCSLRYCPFGDDPQTHCGGSANAQQSVTLDLTITAAQANAGSYPSGATQSWQVDAAVLVVSWRDAAGNEFLTHPVHDLMGATPLSSSALEAALKQSLKALPNYVADSDVTITDATSGAARTVTFTMSGDRNSGDTLQVTCPSQTEYGCPFPGCMPRYQQIRMSAQRITGTAGHVVVEEPVVVSPPSGAEGLALKVTVATTTFDGATITVFSAQTCPIQATATTLTEDSCTTVIASRPVPSRNANSAPVDLGNGLRITFASSTPATGAYEFYYVVGTCSASVDRTAGDSREGIECAGRGTCDRSSGQCQCFEGYQGYNCATRNIVL